MKPICLFLHANPVVGPKYSEALGVSPIFVNRNGLSAVYAETTGLARDYPTLRSLLKRYAPDADPDAPVILLAFSAGCWAARYYLRDPDARQQIAACMLIDGLHGLSEAALSGPEDYARDAMGGRKVLVVTHSQIVPPYTSTRDTADALLRRVGLFREGYSSEVHSGGFHVLPGSGNDGKAHSLQLTQHGVAAAEVYLAPIVEGLTDTMPPDTAHDPDLWDEDTRRVPLGERALEWCRVQSASQKTPTAETKSAWFRLCERDGKVGYLGTKFAGNHCAAAQCAAALAVAHPGDAIPHRYRSAAKELMADAVELGAWHPVAEVRSGAWLPRVGDLAIYDRSQPGRPETSWWGHVDRVSEVGSEDYENLGANEGPGGAWNVQRTPYSHPRLLGFIAYPDPPEAPREPAPSPGDLSDEERRHVESLVALTHADVEADWWKTFRQEGDA